MRIKAGSRPTRIFTAAWAALTVVGAAGLAQGQEFQRIFDGATLTGWHKTGNANWTVTDSAVVGTATGIQVDLDGSNSSGNLYDNVKAAYVAEATKANLKAWYKANDWNDLAIEAKGTRITVTLNGKQTVDFQDAGGRAEGVFAFQMHVGMAMNLKFKDIELRDDSKVTTIGLPPGGARRAGGLPARWHGALPLVSLDILRGRNYLGCQP